MTKLTPMMAQYKQIKDQYPDTILMYRLGDFYEMFFEDALEASKILQITLTSRNKNGENSAPMCGIPFHALEGYLCKLTRAGKKVALCDQMTQPDGKGIVQREVVRVVTPGTTFDENIIDQKANNYVACIVTDKSRFALAYADVTTGEFRVSEMESYKKLEEELMRIGPAECVLKRELLEVMSPLLQGKNIYLFPFDYFKDAENELKNHFAVKSLQGFGLEGHATGGQGKKLAIEVAGMLFEYLRETQKTELTHIGKISYYEVSEFMAMDQALIRNLELFYTSQGKKEGSLISILDQTVSPMGGRMLRNWLLHPLLEKTKVEKRLENVAKIAENSSLLRELRDSLGKIYDIERLLSRLSLGSGNARDLIAMKESLKIIPSLKNLIKGSFADYFGELDELSGLVELIEKAISDEAPHTVREGGMIKKGYNVELDDLLGISTEGKGFIADLQKREIERTGINSLKIKFNSVFGYYIEISNTNLAAVPQDYIRKQTLVNAERFITPELKDYEDKVLNAETRIKELEYELFYGVRMEVVKEILKIQTNARVIAELDVLANLAYISVKNNYCRPQISDGVMEIKNGRHPVIEQLSFAKNFVPNDCNFDVGRKFGLITGPNMGGKSTYLRQVALTVLLAQIGSYVPAESAKIALVDRIFTRVGASDNLTRGESTFMVEMNETAFILNHATEKSLIILDEIGRGTSTYDGVSIAWAIMEFIHDKIGAKTLFATHYHELIELAERLEKAVNLSVLVKENEKEGVVFLYKIVEGGVDKSYGIEVAKLAGLPVDLVSRARGVLSELENRHIKKGRVSPDQIELFDDGAREHKKIDVVGDKMMEELKLLDLNSMTPMQAMQKLHDMKNRSSKED